MCNYCVGGKPFCPNCDDVETVIFSDRLFCFSGKFDYGTEESCGNAVEDRGGSVKKSVTTDLDYLVVGINGSTRYKHNGRGTKIVKAQENKDKG